MSEKKRNLIESTLKENNDYGKKDRNTDLINKWRKKIKNLDTVNKILNKDIVEQYCRKYNIKPIGGFGEYSHYSFILEPVSPSKPQGYRTLKEQFIDEEDNECEVWFQGLTTENEYEFRMKYI